MWRSPRLTGKWAVYSLVALISASALTVSVVNPGRAFANINNTRADAWGTNELGGGSWLNGGGVDIYSNGAQISYTPDKPNNTVGSIVSGEEWQCVEMVNRLYLTNGWTSSRWSGNGNTLIAHLPSTLTNNEQGNGYVTYLSQGDVITLDDGGYGHAGIINSVSGNSIQIANQNTTQVYSSASISSGSYTAGGVSISMVGWSGYSVQAIVHHPAPSGWGGVGTTSTYSGGNGMASGTTLNLGYYLTSNNVQNAFLFQSGDGNAVVYSGGHAAYPFGTGGLGGVYLDMQSDGNLVMYKANHTTSVWQSGSGGNPGATLVMQDDGNLVIYSATGMPLWFTGTGGNPNLTAFGSDRLTSALGATQLTQGQYLKSADGRHAVLMQTNGDAVLYGPGAHQLWHTNTAGHGDRFTQQIDGNLVLYALSTPYWQSFGSGTSYYTVIQNDGNFVQYNSTGSTAIWPSGTGGQI